MFLNTAADYIGQSPATSVLAAFIRSAPEGRYDMLML